MLTSHNIIDNIEESAEYSGIPTSFLLEELILKKTNNTFLEELISPNEVKEKQLRGLLGACNSTSICSEQIINVHEYFLQQAITVKNAPLIEDNDLSDQIVDLLQSAHEYSLPLIQEKPGYLLGDEIKNNCFFLAEKKADFLNKDGYLAVIVSNATKKRKGYKGDLSIVSSQYLGDGKFMANSLQGLRLNTEQALKHENIEQTNLRNNIACAIMKRKELFDEVKNYVSSRKNNGDVETMKILTGRRIPYR